MRRLLTGASATDAEPPHLRLSRRKNRRASGFRPERWCQALRQHRPASLKRRNSRQALPMIVLGARLFSSCATRRSLVRRSSAAAEPSEAAGVERRRCVWRKFSGGENRLQPQAYGVLETENPRMDPVGVRPYGHG